MSGEHLRDQRLAFRRQVNHPCSSVGRVIFPCHQVPRLEPIDRRGHRPAGEIDSAGQFADGLRALVQKGFENREVRQAHIERLDAARRMTRQGAMRFHENEPGVYGRRVSSALRHGCEPRIAGPSGLALYLTTSILISYNLMSSYIYQ